VLCAGAYGSPKMLQLSGIGPAEYLSSLGLPVLRDVPAVGENFQDHIASQVLGRTREPISLLGNDRGLRALRHGVQYVLFRSGLLTSNLIESGGFVDTDHDGRPDIQFHCIPSLSADTDRPPPPGHGVTLSVCILRPKSRGQVRLRSRDPSDPVKITTNWLTNQDDMDTLLRGIKLGRNILHAPTMKRIIEKELAPSDGNGEPTRAQLEDHARRTAKTVFHPVGTCRMGSDPEAVVDPQLRVFGVPRLRVADNSIMPTLVSGNTNAAAIMIGERCADFLLGANR
jgi:choline dehydrogenase-like flavoprotein